MKEKLKKLPNIFKNKYFYYTVAFFLILLLAVFDLKEKLNNKGITSNKYILILTLIGVIIFVIFILITIFLKKKKPAHHVVFAILALVFGSMYLIGSPLFTGSDEHNHYYRIYEITNGNFVTPVVDNKIVGDKLPSSLYETFTNNAEETVNRNTKIKYRDELDMMQVELAEDEVVQYGTEYAKEYSNTALYCPIQYLPQIIGFMFAKLLNLGPFWMGEFGRLFNLLAYVAICTFFLKKLPRLKTFAMLVLLSPVLLSNATTLSADAFLNATLFGFITMLVNNRYQKEPLKRHEKVIYFILSILLAACKIVYLLFVFLLFLLTNKNFKSKKERLTFIIPCIVISCIVGLLWMQATNPYFEAYYVNTEIQKEHILGNILGYFVVVLRTYMSQFNSLLLNLFAGTNMYHSQLPVYSFISLAYIVIVILAFFIKEKDKKKEEIDLSLKEYLFTGVILLGILALVTTAIYIQCTSNFIAIDNPQIVGLQGRYYLAFVLCAILLGNKKNLKLKLNDNNLLLESSLLLQIAILLTMVVCFAV